MTVVVNDSYNRGGMFPVYEVGLHGPADNFQPPVSFWASQAGMKAGGGSLYAIPSAVVTPPGSPLIEHPRRAGKLARGCMFLCLKAAGVRSCSDVGSG